MGPMAGTGVRAAALGAVGAIAGAVLVAAGTALAPAQASHEPVGSDFVTPTDALTSAPRIFSGGEPARHVCFAGATSRDRNGAPLVLDPAPCKRHYAPLRISVDERLYLYAYPGGEMVVARFGVPSSRLACGRTLRSLFGPRDAGLNWTCRIPGRPYSARRLSLSMIFRGGGHSRWVFDVMLLPRGFRATAQEAQVRFRIADRYLRMQLLPRRFPQTDLRGKRLKVTCVRRGWSRSAPHEGAAIRRVRWPKWQLGMSLTFERPLGGSPSWCRVEHRGEELALAKFPRRR
jgi:hypothetical protein